MKPKGTPFLLEKPIFVAHGQDSRHHKRTSFCVRWILHKFRLNLPVSVLSSPACYHKLGQTLRATVDHHLTDGDAVLPLHWGLGGGVFWNREQCYVTIGGQASAKRLSSLSEPMTGKVVF